MCVDCCFLKLVCYLFGVVCCGFGCWAGCLLFAYVLMVWLFGYAGWCGLMIVTCLYCCLPACYVNSVVICTLHVCVFVVVW